MDAAALGDWYRRQAANTANIDSALVGPSYPDAYELGDTISVQVRGVRVPMIVDGVAFNITATRSTILPILGRMPNDEATAIMRELFGTTAQLQAGVA